MEDVETEDKENTHKWLRSARLKGETIEFIIADYVMNMMKP